MSQETTRALTNAAFRFVVEIEGVAQGAFTECTLPTVEWETQEVKEGGLNAFTHQLPGRRKGAKLSLKNGVGSSDLVTWCQELMGESFTRKTVAVTLLDAMLEPIMTWSLLEAYPIKWNGPALKSGDNSIAIQTLEFAGGEVTVST